MVSSSKPREIRWKNLIADKWLSMVVDRKLLVANEYATYSNNCRTLDKPSVLEKNGHTTTYPKVYPCAKMPLISAFRRGRNGDPHEFEANTEVAGVPQVPHLPWNVGASGAQINKNGVAIPA